MCVLLHHHLLLSIHLLVGLVYVIYTYSGLDHGATPEEMNEVIAFLQRVLG